MATDVIFVAFAVVLGARDRQRIWRAHVIAAFGGGCQLCGYQRCSAALHFHHVYGYRPAGRRSRSPFQSWHAAVAYVQETVLLCSNCHCEVESGYRSLPKRVIKAGLRFGDALVAMAANAETPV